MKVTKREGTRPSYRASISIKKKQAENFESALTFLEQHRNDSASQVVIDLVLAAAKKAGWKQPITPASS